MSWAAAVNPKAWREGLSQGISHVSFSPTSAQKSSKGLSIIVISWASQELSGLRITTVILPYISVASLTIILHISFQLWSSGGVWSCGTLGTMKIQMERQFPVPQTLQSLWRTNGNRKILVHGKQCDYPALHSGERFQYVSRITTFCCSNSHYWRKLIFSFSFNLFLKFRVYFLYVGLR